MEVSYKSEVASLLNGEGDVMDGENVMAVVKGLLQSGVAYVGGYQGAPVSHVLDVLADAKEDVLDELGVYFESSASEAAAAAMLSASVNYPMRGAVAWKSVVGTNVAADPLSAIASVGVVGGALIIIGEDYGQGTSIIQERTHAFALKCTMPLLDPRPEQQNVVDMVEKGFRLSEASNMPVMLMLRIRAAHLNGSFVCRDNVEPKISRKHPFDTPAPFTPGRINYGPALFENEQDKVEKRLPAARRFIVENAINEIFCDDASQEVGIILQGGLYNTVIAALNQLGLADAFGESRIPLFVLNATFPLVPEQITEFCATQALGADRRGRHARLHPNRKSTFPCAGATCRPRYTARTCSSRPVSTRRNWCAPACDVTSRPPARRGWTPVTLPPATMSWWGASPRSRTARNPLTAKPPWPAATCPSRCRRAPPLSAPGARSVRSSRPSKSCSASSGRPTSPAISAATRSPPTRHSICPIRPPATAWAWSSAAAVEPASRRRTITVMGDGGLWHSGLNAGVAGAVYNNKQDTVLAVINNGFTSATGQQRIPASGINHRGEAVDMDLGRALKGVGVEWVKTIDSYDLRDTVKTLRDALTTSTKGVKAIIVRASASSTGSAACARKTKPARRPASASCVRASGSTRTCAPATARASGFPGARRSPSNPRRTPCATTRWPMSTTVASAAATAARSPTWPSSVPRSTGPTSSRTRLSPSAPWKGGGVSSSGCCAGARRPFRRPPERAPPPWSPRRFAQSASSSPRSPAKAAESLPTGSSRRPARRDLSPRDRPYRGVAQRTGATTYYIEVFPLPEAELGGKKPVLAIYPIKGDVDLLVGGEMVEAGRMANLGYVTPGHGDGGEQPSRLHAHRTHGHG